MPRRILLSLIVALIAGLAAPAAALADSSGAYFPATGHTLTDSGGFASFWYERDGMRLLGMPVTEPLTIEGGTAQYFEKGRLEQRLDATGALTVTMAPVALEYVTLLGRSFPAMPQRRLGGAARFFETTGHSLRAPFLGFWQSAGGEQVLGAPISEPLWEVTELGERRVQYFANARLERDPNYAGTPDEVQIANLGKVLAELRGISTAAVANPGFATFGPPRGGDPDVAPIPMRAPPRPPAPSLLTVDSTRAAPAVSAVPAAPQRSLIGGRKIIIVNLSKQWMYAYEGDDRVYSAPVSTGRDGMNTPTGTYSIYAKLRIQTMRGVLDGIPWVVPDVPHVMYINGGVALHGTYWHSRFGTGARLSHGCVNLPLKSATWLYDWAPVGTPVQVTY